MSTHTTIPEAGAQANVLPEHKRIFLVDVNPRRTANIKAVLSKLYTVRSFPNGGAALEAMRTNPPHLVIIDETTMSKRGHGIHKTKTHDHLLKFIPFIILSNLTEGPLVIGGGEGVPDHYLKRPFSSDGLFTQISASLSYAVEHAWEKLPKVAQRSLKNTMKEFSSISKAIESGEALDFKAAHESCRSLVECVQSNQYQDVLNSVRKHHNYTYVHSLRVATYLTVFGNAVGMKAGEIQILTTGGLLHDVGKMTTPQHILNKPGKLNDHEWVIMKGHVDHSRKILAALPEINESIRVIAQQHHERFDGSGYPLGLKSNQLNELARMAAIVDIFVALTDERSYKPAFPEDKSFSILEEMGPVLDQRLVKTFREVVVN